MPEYFKIILENSKVNRFTLSISNLALIKNGSFEVTIRQNLASFYFDFALDCDSDTDPDH